MSISPPSIAAAIRKRVAAPRKVHVWTPEDFADLGPRPAVDQALHRLVAAGKLRRIARGFYDIPGTNRLTGKPTSPDPRAVIDALARKNNVRVLVDGITAANDLGLTDAVPARITVFTDARLRPIILGKLTISLRQAAPSRLHWAGRPAMRFVQALDWLRDVLPSDEGQWDAQIFTNDRSALANALGHDVSHQSAYQPQQAIVPPLQAPNQGQMHEHPRDLDMGMGMGL